MFRNGKLKITGRMGPLLINQVYISCKWDPLNNTKLQMRLRQNWLYWESMLIYKEL